MLQRRSHRLRLAALASAAVIGLGLVGSTPALAGGNHGGGTPKVVATGLDNPRQLSFTSSGDLLVAERARAVPVRAVGPRGRRGLLRHHGCGHPDQLAGQAVADHQRTAVARGEGHRSVGDRTHRRARRGRGLVLIGLGATPEARRAAGGRPADGHADPDHRTTARSARSPTWRRGRRSNNPIEDPDSNPAGMLARPRQLRGRRCRRQHRAEGQPAGGIRQLAEFESRLVDAPPFLGLPPAPRSPCRRCRPRWPPRATTAPTTSAS